MLWCIVSLLIVKGEKQMPIPAKKMNAFIQQNKKKPAFPMKAKQKFEADEEEKENTKVKKPEEQEADGQEEEKDYSQIVEEEAKKLDDGEPDEEIVEKMQGFDFVVDDFPEWVTEPEDQDKWNAAKDAVDPEGEGAKYDDPWLLIAHVYKRLGGKIV
jgi:hypothetical protein